MFTNPTRETDPRRLQLDLTISWTTILKILTACLLAYLAIQLWPLAELLLLALLIAITLWPLLEWTQKRGWPKWVGVLLCALVLLAFVVLFVVLLIPTVITQGAALIEKLPEFKADAINRLSKSGPARHVVDQLLSSPAFTDPAPLVKHFMEWGRAALAGLVGFFVVLVVAVYFVADGERVYHWLLAFLPEVHRKKMGAASEEIASVVGHYMAGQLITSVLCGIYVFGLLTFLHVPNSALLALVAGIFDVLPLIGFFLSIIPSVATALTVSPVTALLVGVLYLAYHLVENYFIVPKVYGDRLRLSTLTVLVSCMAAGLVAGVVGAIAVLPIVASYPIVERIWLRPFLERDTVKKHAEIDEKMG